MAKRAKKRYYAVRRGRKTGIFRTWGECKKQVHGYPQSAFKGFVTLEEAQSFMTGTDLSKLDLRTEQEIVRFKTKYTAVAYVNGSSNKAVCAYGVIIFYKGEVHKAAQPFYDISTASMRGAAGEIKGAEYAMRYCVEHCIPKLMIYYDYEGTAYWCSGEWKANKAGTRAYRDYCISVKDKLDIRFVKAEDDINFDMAAELAEAALNSRDGQALRAEAAMPKGKSAVERGENANTYDEQSVRQFTTDDAATAYVDGSYNNATGIFSFGAVIFYRGNTHTSSRAFIGSELASMHNVAGEIKGAEYAMRYCVEHGIPKLVIYHDYTGISRWCTGEWKANKPGTRAYRDYYRSIRDKLEVEFVKVKGHSGDVYNDMADELAKSASGV